MNTRFIRNLVATMILLGGAGQAHALTPPLVFSHHGLLYSDNELASGVHTIRARIYNDLDEVIAEQTLTDYTVTDGYYSMSLDVDYEKLMAAGNITLGLKVDNKPEMEPRLPISSVPFALLSKHAELADDVQCEGCVTLSHLSDGEALGRLLEGANETGAVTNIAAGAVGADQIAVNYALSDTKGGDALKAKEADHAAAADNATSANKALDLDCSTTPCVSNSELATDIKYALADKKGGTAVNAKDSAYAAKIGTSSSHPAIGSATTPVYVDSDGTIKAGTAFGSATVGTANTALDVACSGQCVSSSEVDFTWAKGSTKGGNAAVADKATNLVCSSTTGCVDEADLVANAVTTAKIKDSAVTTNKVNFNWAAGATKGGNATKANLALDLQCTAETGCVDTADIVAGAVSTSKLADGSVNADKIGTSAITESKINTGAVTTTKIADGAVSSAKVAFNYAGSSSKGGAATNATDSSYAAKIGTSSSHPSIGGSTTPVYIDNGTIKAATAYSSATVAKANLASDLECSTAGCVGTADIANKSVTQDKLNNLYPARAVIELSLRHQDQSPAGPAGWYPTVTTSHNLSTSINYTDGVIDFTFTEKMPNSNYMVLTDFELLNTNYAKAGHIMVTNKTINGFTAKIYNLEISSSSMNLRNTHITAYADGVGATTATYKFVVY